MRAGLLTEPVTFKRATITKNEYGQEVTYWENYIITRGNVKYNTGNNKCSLTVFYVKYWEK